MNTVLFSFRVLHNLNEDVVARKLCLSFKEYQDLESGNMKTNPKICSSLASLYNAPAEVFISHNMKPSHSVIFSQCHFNNSNGYVNHCYDGGTTNVDVIKLLLEEIFRLREQNERLIKMLSKD
jgi:hypothetical protein